jgi:protein-S-isoprenylcysteine O-methyltransferase Ste14
MNRVGALLKTALFTVLVPEPAIVLVPWLLRGHPSIPVSDFEEVAAILVVTIGVLIYLHTAFWGLAWTGGGTPAPIAPTKTLVVRGLHRFVRNPMYLGVLLAIAGQAWLFHSRQTAIYLVCLWLAFHLFALFYEEPTLKKAIRRRVRSLSRACAAMDSEILGLDSVRHSKSTACKRKPGVRHRSANQAARRVSQ